MTEIAVAATEHECHTPRIYGNRWTDAANLLANNAAERNMSAAF